MGATRVTFIHVPCSTEWHDVSVSLGVYDIRRTSPSIATTIPANTPTLRYEMYGALTHLLLIAVEGTFRTCAFSV